MFGSRNGVSCSIAAQHSFEGWDKMRVNSARTKIDRIFAAGDAPKGLTFRDVAFSAPARAKLEAVGATFEE